MRACRFCLHRSRPPRALDQVGGPAAARELAIREVVDLATDQVAVEMGMAGVSVRALGPTHRHRLRLGAKRSQPQRRRTIRCLPPPVSSARAVAAISALTDRRAVAATQVVQGNRLVLGNRVSGNRVSGNRATGWLVALAAQALVLVARAVALAARAVPLVARAVALAAQALVLVARAVALAARAVPLVARAVALAARAVAPVARAVALVARAVALVARAVALAARPVASQRRWLRARVRRGGPAVRRVRGAVRWVRAAVGCGKRWVGAHPEHFRQRRPGERVG